MLWRRLLVKCESALLIISLLSVSRIAWAGDDVWTSNGPYGGAITAVVIDPQNPEIVYAATDENGVYKSTDGGSSWTTISRGLNSYWVNALAIDPQNPTTLYAGTFTGVYKSTDAGGRWQKVTNEPSNVRRSVYSLTIDPQNPSIVYAGAYNGLLKTADGGNTWKQITPGHSNRIDAVAVAPQNSATVYCEEGKSVDGGDTWNGTCGDSSVSSLAVDPQNQNIVYKGYWTKGVYKSTDAGGHWSPANNGLSDYTTFTVKALAIDPQNPAIVYAATDKGGLFKSIDNANSWTRLTPKTFNVTSVVVNPRDSAVLYFGSYGSGVFKSTDGGESGRNALVWAFAESLVIDPTNPSRLFAGTRNNGLFVSIDGGNSWTNASASSAGMQTTILGIDSQNPPTLYGGASELYKSTDGGVSWVSAGWEMCGYASDQFPPIRLGCQQLSMAIDPKTPATLYLGQMRSAEHLLPIFIHHMAWRQRREEHRRRRYLDYGIGGV